MISALGLKGGLTQRLQRVNLIDTPMQQQVRMPIVVIRQDSTDIQNELRSHSRISQDG